MSIAYELPDQTELYQLEKFLQCDTMSEYCAIILKLKSQQLKEAFLSGKADGGSPERNSRR